MPISPLKDNDQIPLPNLTDVERSVLEEIGNRSLGELVKERPELLVFPHCLGDNRDDTNDPPVM